MNLSRYEIARIRQSAAYRLFKQGLTFSQIGRELGETREAVAGLVYRYRNRKKKRAAL